MILPFLWFSIRRDDFDETSKIAIVDGRAEAHVIAIARSPKVKAWQNARKDSDKGVDWQFTTTDARIKLKRLYPQSEERKGYRTKNVYRSFYELLAKFHRQVGQ
jgi:hypothetical protein